MSLQTSIAALVAAAVKEALAPITEALAPITERLQRIEEAVFSETTSQSSRTSGTITPGPPSEDSEMETERFSPAKTGKKRPAPSPSPRDEISTENRFSSLSEEEVESPPVSDDESSPLNQAKDVWKVKTVCSLVIKAEKPRKSSKAAQCHRCQRFHHAQRNCTAEHRCVKCGEAHETKVCTKERAASPKCANCSGPHTDNYMGCPKFPKVQAQRTKVAAPKAILTATKGTGATKKTAKQRQTVNFGLQKSQIATSVATAKSSKELAEKLSAYIALLLNN
ncbi:uncharacterized protein LOC123009100 [Tribolium madens]|uniref:uncharacterized protein LOC123009100 n=1 Tax=Tribolium madens TaxID=41895 RepID=UPI001CF72A9F|nr:uncharacterized protein LOC123009100 [Tribolium madens]